MLGVLSVLIILNTGCAARKYQLVSPKDYNLDIMENKDFPISNIHINSKDGDLLLKGSVSRRFGKLPLLSGDVDITFINIDGQTRKKECFFLIIISKIDLVNDRQILKCL